METTRRFFIIGGVLSALASKFPFAEDGDITKPLPSEIQRAAIPPGTVVAVNGPVPTGWLPCDGRFVTRSAYPELFAAIGLSQDEMFFDTGKWFRVPDLHDQRYSPYRLVVKT